jgi:hypothetical protein
MKIAKPLLLTTTPLGVAGGLFEAYRLAGGLVILMAAMMGVIGAGMATVVVAVRREKAAERARRESSATPAAVTPAGEARS